ncbi:MAG: hypothetical protein LBC87_08655 [Fibromonadaceae bacterium]|jgi:hypothetical protein|nr:hypothetical protein [Fibromonadaceae bacterium]
MRSIFSKFALLAVLGFALVFTFSCSSGGSGGGGYDEGVINAKNEAWVVCDNKGCNGIIIKNGEWIVIYRENGGNWNIEERGSYSIEGDQITSCDYKHKNCDVTSYSLFGNKLTLKFEDGERVTFTRTSGVNISSGGSSSSAGTKGEVPASIIPPAIRTDIEKTMTIYSGTTPPDISGQYMADNLILIGSSISGEKLDNLADLYFAFVKGSNGALLYREKQSDSYAASDNVRVEVVGSGNNFTAYFESVGESRGISTRMSTLISGTLTTSGIKNFNYAFVMLEKGSDPNNSLVPVNTYRVFKDGDGLAERYDWLVLSSSSSILGGSSSSSGIFKNSEIVFINADIPTGTANIINSVQYISNPSVEGSGTLIVSSSRELSELYLKIDGKSGYYVREVSEEDISYSGSGTYVYSVNLDFSSGFPIEQQKINVSVKTTEEVISKNVLASNSNVTQSKCNAQSISGGEAGYIGNVQMGQNDGSFEFSYNTYTIPDKITIYDGYDTRGDVIFSYSGGTGGKVYDTVYFNASVITVEVIGLGTGTEWNFLVNCPE